MTPAGRVAASGHPRALGSALCNPHITTDFSEALLELVTPTFTDNAALARYLAELHHFVAQRLGDELLWAASMPGEIAGENEVPIAQYGRSHRGHFKEVYRRGLQNRYGGLMQAIAGAHYNYSFPERFWPLWADLLGSHRHDGEFVSARYFDLVRNYRRHGWLALYLFGVSPALCASFVPEGGGADMQPLGPGTLHLPYATSLRMSDLGYRNRDQSAVAVSVNALDEYLRDLQHATHTVHPPFAALGLCVDGQYRQLNTNILQIENEYYSNIRLEARAARRARARCVRWRAAGSNTSKCAPWTSASSSPPACARTRCISWRPSWRCAWRAAAIRSARPSRTCWTTIIYWSRGAAARRICSCSATGVPCRSRPGARNSSTSSPAYANCWMRISPTSPTVARSPGSWKSSAIRSARRRRATCRSCAARAAGFADYTRALSVQHRERLLDEAGRDPDRQAEFAAEAAESLREQEAVERADRGSFGEYLARALAPPPAQPAR